MELMPVSYNNDQQLLSHQNNQEWHQLQQQQQQGKLAHQTRLGYTNSSSHPASQSASGVAATAATRGCSTQACTTIVGSTLPAQPSSLLQLHPVLQACDRPRQPVLGEVNLNKSQDTSWQQCSRDLQGKQQHPGPCFVPFSQSQHLHALLPQQQSLQPALQHVQHAGAGHGSDQSAVCASSSSRTLLHGCTLCAEARAAPRAAADSVGLAGAIAAASARLQCLLDDANACRNSDNTSAQQQQQQQVGRLANGRQPGRADYVYLPTVASASINQSCMHGEDFSNPCDVKACYGSLDSVFGDADSVADMELDGAADSVRAAKQQLQQWTLQWLLVASSSIGAQELATAAAAGAAGNDNILLNGNSKTAEHEHASVKHFVLQQVLNKAAVQRKRGAVLLAGPEAGSRSGRVRLLVTELAVYSSTGKPLVQAAPWLRSAGPPISCGCSAADLSLCNHLMSKVKLPGNIQYVPVPPSSRIFSAGASWRLPAFVVCLASSYLQRLVAQDATLAKAAAACSGFEVYHSSLPQLLQRRFSSRASSERVAAAVQRLRSIKCACLYLALKVADSVHARGLLTYMLGQVTGVTHAAAEAAELETWVLRQLGWRLGPFYAEQEDADWSTGGEGQLWAQAVSSCCDYELAIE